MINFLFSRGFNWTSSDYCPLEIIRSKVKKVRINKEKYFGLIEHTDAKAIMVFHLLEAYRSENDLNVRDFADYYGIPEDGIRISKNQFKIPFKNYSRRVF